MDFIPELPECEGYNNVFVLVDKLTKYVIFIPTTTTVTEKGTAELFFQHIISQYGIPRQVITDRDIQWKGEFWKEICDRMGMKRALTMAYHPQADRQTEIMNQSLEISLRAYIGPKRDNWVSSLNGLALSYNSTPHTATSFSPAYLLRGMYQLLVLAFYILPIASLEYRTLPFLSNLTIKGLFQKFPTILHFALKPQRWLNYSKPSDNKHKKLYNLANISRNELIIGDDCRLNLKKVKRF
jgi:hypothetical protein